MAGWRKLPGLLRFSILTVAKVNIKEPRELIGTIVILRPRPKIGGRYVKESYNSWTIVAESRTGYSYSETQKQIMSLT